MNRWPRSMWNDNERGGVHFLFFERNRLRVVLLDGEDAEEWKEEPILAVGALRELATRHEVIGYRQIESAAGMSSGHELELTFRRGQVVVVDLGDREHFEEAFEMLGERLPRHHRTEEPAPLLEWLRGWFLAPCVVALMALYASWLVHMATRAAEVEGQFGGGLVGFLLAGVGNILGTAGLVVLLGVILFGLSWWSRERFTPRRLVPVFYRA